MDLELIKITVSIIGILITIITQWEKIINANWWSLGGVFSGVFTILLVIWQIDNNEVDLFHKIFGVVIGIFMIVLGITAGFDKKD